MGEVIATRAAYGKALVKFGETVPELIVMDADLAGATMTNGFAKAFPERFLDMGIAEADMMGVAAGLAACGKKVFATSFAMFAAGRAWEQVRNSICYPRLGVKVVGSHGGLSVGEDGATHQCIEDFAIMRAIPGMTVLCPCDGHEMEQAVKALIDYDGPAYMRLGRLAVETVTDSVEGYRFELGKGVTLLDGSDVTIIAVGMMVQEALKAAGLLKADGISARVIDMHTIKPLDEELVLAAARETGAVVTSEEANVIGGLGSAVCELLSARCPVPVIRHGVNDQFGRSGKAPLVLQAYGLTAEVIAEKAREAVELKGRQAGSLGAL
ncbi:transketolase family protein [Yanshouia hominis]|uniref:Transketolase family protein n=1 Tax=Yanshouia hominis TaxID=2763673 RepID=A0ABR7NJU2_9FIRM|nr:transketolase family protein [Yanshouia hominis]MBC8575908.1 transketolase family protein [Yanshouia hominis]